jgi:hypothetical protein
MGNSWRVGKFKGVRTSLAGGKFATAVAAARIHGRRELARAGIDAKLMVQRI